MSNDKSGPAFPPMIPGHGFQGLSIRDYFAAQALPAVIRHITTDGKFSEDLQTPSFVAELAYGLADAMLAKRSKP